MVEAIETIRVLMLTWLEANTNQRFPTIGLLQDCKNAQVNNNQDWVLLDETSSSTEYPGINMGFHDDDWTITIQMMSNDYNQVLLMDAEVLRILNANIITPADGNSWLEPKGRRWIIKNENKKLYIIQRDVDVVKISVVI